MDTPQMFTLAVATWLLSILYKSTFLSRGSLKFNRTIPWIIFLTYVLCFFAMYFVLARWSADDVRSDSEAVLFYFAACGITLVMMQEAFRWCGVSVRDDAIERRNPAAAIVGVAQIAATTFCLAGSNVGNGPGPEVVAFCVAFSVGALVVLWLVLDRLARVGDTITVERDIKAGWRVAAWCLSTGAILGASVTGDWASYLATLRDFAKYGWPVLVLFVIAAVSERYFASQEEARRDGGFATTALVVFELGGALAYAAWVLHP